MQTECAVHRSFSFSSAILSLPLNQQRNQKIESSGRTCETSHCSPGNSRLFRMADSASDRCAECTNTFGEEVDYCDCMIRSFNCTSQGIRKNSKRFPPLGWKCTSETTPADHTLVVTGVTRDCFTDCRDGQYPHLVLLTHILAENSATFSRSPIDSWNNWYSRIFTDLFGNSLLAKLAALIALLLTMIVFSILGAILAAIFLFFAFWPIDVH